MKLSYWFILFLYTIILPYTVGVFYTWVLAGYHPILVLTPVVAIAPMLIGGALETLKQIVRRSPNAYRRYRWYSGS